MSLRIREQSPVPVFLAGALNRDNVAEAVRAVEPFGLDLCSSVRTNGRLDETKLQTFSTRQTTNIEARFVLHLTVELVVTAAVRDFVEFGRRQ